MRHQAVPDHRLECFGMWSNARDLDRRNHHDAIADLFRVPAVASHHAEYLHAALFRLFEAGHDICADVLFHISAPDGEHEHGIILVRSARLEPRRKHRVPALVIRARSEFGDIVHRRIGFDAAKFAKVTTPAASIDLAIFTTSSKNVSECMFFVREEGARGNYSRCADMKSPLALRSVIYRCPELVPASGPPPSRRTV